MVFLSLGSTMDGLTATNRVMLPSSGRKVNYTHFLSTYSHKSSVLTEQLFIDGYYPCGGINLADVHANTDLLTN